MFRHGDPGGRIYTAVGASYVNILYHWTSVTGTWAVSASNGRTTGSCLRLNWSDATSTYLLKFLDQQATWGIATAMRLNSAIYPAGGNGQLLGFLDSATLQVDLRLYPDGSLSVTRNGTILGTTATGIFPLNAWVHIELKVTIHPSAGTVVLYVNGISKLNLTSLNTRNSANSYATSVFLGNYSATNPSLGSSKTVDYDDVIVYDGVTTDAAGNSDIVGPIGDCGLAWLLPTGAGNSTQFTPSAGANYTNVDDTTPDVDSTYVESSTIGHIDSYALADLPSGAATIKSLASIHYARKTDAGSRTMDSLVRTGSSNYGHSTDIVLSDSYQYFFRNWGENPGTTNAWTVSEVNSLELGQEVLT